MAGFVCIGKLLDKADSTAVFGNGIFSYISECVFAVKKRIYYYEICSFWFRLLFPASLSSGFAPAESALFFPGVPFRADMPSTEILQPE